MINKETAKAGNMTIGVTASGFPFSLFKEWEKDCLARFNNLRWTKMWSDHQEAQSMQLLKEKISELEQRIMKLEGTEPKKEDKVLTLGDE